MPIKGKKGDNMHKFGVVSVSFRKHTVEEILEASQKAGLSYIEWGSDVHAPYDNLPNLERIAVLQEKYGIKCSSYGTYFKVGETPTELLEKYIDAAEILGTNILRLWCGNKNSEDYGENEKAQLFKECKKAAENAAKRNAVLCMECHRFTYTNKREAALELMKEVNSDNFKMYWQPGEFCSIDENEQYAADIAEHTKIIHAFNWKGNMRYKLSEGADEWKRYMAYFPEDITLLLEFMPDDRIESLKEEADALKSFF